MHWTFIVRRSDALMYQVIASEVFSSRQKSQKDKSCENGSHFIKKTSHLEEIAKLYDKNSHIDSYQMQTGVKKKKKVLKSQSLKGSAVILCFISIKTRAARCVTAELHANNLIWMCTASSLRCAGSNESFIMSFRFRVLKHH